MIRLNVHFEESWLKKLDEIKVSVQNLKGESYYLRNITRSDLIRLAVATAYRFDDPYIHSWGGGLNEVLKKILKKRSQAKGV